MTPRENLVMLVFAICVPLASYCGVRGRERKALVWGAAGPVGA